MNPPALRATPSCENRWLGRARCPQRADPLVMLNGFERRSGDTAVFNGTRGNWNSRRFRLAWE